MFIPKISIITPSFNQGKFLEETILSVVNQDYPSYELIIIDAGSTDDTLDVIHKYEQYITYWVSEPDRGQSHAIQKGLVQVTGDIVNWINSDDLVAPGTFHRIAKEFDMVRYDVICGKCDYFLDSLSSLDLRGMQMGLGHTVGETILQHKINQPSTYFKASVMKYIGIDEQFRYTMDVDLWYRYLLEFGQNRVFLSDGLFSYFRLHAASKSVAESSGFNGEVWMVHYNIFRSLGQTDALLKYAARLVPNFDNFIPSYYKIGIERKELYEFINEINWRALVYYNSQKNYAFARQCLKAARQNGRLLDATMVKQLIKLNLLPDALLRRLT